MSKIELILGDCLEVMKNMPDKSVDLVFTSPPYNLVTSKKAVFTVGKTKKEILSHITFMTMIWRMTIMSNGNT